MHTGIPLTQRQTLIGLLVAVLAVSTSAWGAPPVDVTLDYTAEAHASIAATYSVGVDTFDQDDVGPIAGPASAHAYLLVDNDPYYSEGDLIATIQGSNGVQSASVMTNHTWTAVEEDLGRTYGTALTMLAGTLAVGGTGPVQLHVDVTESGYGIPDYADWTLNGWIADPFDILFQLDTNNPDATVGISGGQTINIDFMFNYTDYNDLVPVLDASPTIEAVFTAEAVPEPGTLAILGAGAVALLRRRRCQND